VRSSRLALEITTSARWARRSSASSRRGGMAFRACPVEEGNVFGRHSMNVRRLRKPRRASSQPKRRSSSSTSRRSIARRVEARAAVAGRIGACSPTAQARINAFAAGELRRRLRVIAAERLLLITLPCLPMDWPREAFVSCIAIGDRPSLMPAAAHGIGACSGKDVERTVFAARNPALVNASFLSFARSKR